MCGLGEWGGGWVVVSEFFFTQNPIFFWGGTSKGRGRVSEVYVHEQMFQMAPVQNYF